MIIHKNHLIFYDNKSNLYRIPFSLPDKKEVLLKLQNIEKMFFYSKELIQNKKYTIGEKLPDNCYLIKFKN